MALITKPCRKNKCCSLLTFPIASSPLSKKNITPKKRKNTPKPVTPIPISAKERIRYLTSTVSLYDFIDLPFILPGVMAASYLL